MTQEFHISVTPVGKDEYLVRTERVAPGVPLAEEQVVWPVGNWLAQARQLMNDPLIGLLEGSSPSGAVGNRAQLMQADNLSPFAQPNPNQPPLSLVELGQQFYGSLFQGMLRDSWVTAQGIAQNRNESLRLRLGLKGPQLPRLPWEVLYGNDTPTPTGVRSGSLSPAARPLATGTHVIFSRYQPNARLATQCLSGHIDPQQPLRVLMVIAAPTDRERLELEREAHQLQQELQSVDDSTSPSSTHRSDHRSQLDIQLTILKQPGREQLTQALEQGRYQVLHYAGHSDLGTAGGSLYLVNRRTGLSEILSGDDLAGLLVNNGIRLAVFNSCRGAYTAASVDHTQERNLAEALVSRGIPAVLAMAEQIPDNVALTLTWLFYRNLKLGYPIDLSLSRARQGLISAYGSHQLYWALPILYLHPNFDGYLTTDNRASNLADQLILVPQRYSALPILSTEEAIAPLESPTSTSVSGNWQPGELARSERDALSRGQGAGFGDLEESDNEAQIMAELLRQLTPPEQPGLSSPGSTVTPVAPMDTQPDMEPPGTPELVPVVPGGGDGSIHSGASATVSSPPQPLVRQISRSRRLLSAVGLAGAISIAVLGVWSLARVQDSSILQFPQTSSLPLLGGTPDLQTAEPEQVKTVAVNSFRRGNYDEGEAAVAVLLDRGNLRDAAEALASVPTSVDSANINFLWGRLAWQGIDTGNPVYTVTNARRYWERAVRAEPENAMYLEALGFAYYAENNPMQAMQTWARTLSLLEDQPMSAQQAATQALNVSSESSPDGTLTTYAGLSLALWKAASDQPISQQNSFLRRSIDLYRSVQQKDPHNFQPQALRRNWLWTEAAIQDWETLGQYR
ncbi:CHAT domain-containing protein [Egbenema bharatensis]|uniref:CHAT domain-containing protein n=1 Tax=Egbenema bharatensis TaxID=3463334 RepID=UPI003A89882D